MTFYKCRTSMPFQLKNVCHGTRTINCGRYQSKSGRGWVTPRIGVRVPWHYNESLRIICVFVLVVLKPPFLYDVHVAARKIIIKLIPLRTSINSYIIAIISGGCGFPGVQNYCVLSGPHMSRSIFGWSLGYQLRKF